MHPPKRETFDVAGRTNTDPKGFVRPVDVYSRLGDALYMARPADHPKFHYLESWLLPTWNLRITDFHFTPGNELDQDFYIDVMDIRADDSGPWTTRDLYLDITCKAGEFTRVYDTDEVTEAIAEGVISPAEGESAIETTLATVSALVGHGHDLGAWLRSEGLDLTWTRH